MLYSRPIITTDSYREPQHQQRRAQAFTTTYTTGGAEDDRLPDGSKLTSAHLTSFGQPAALGADVDIDAGLDLDVNLDLDDLASLASFDSTDATSSQSAPSLNSLQGFELAGIDGFVSGFGDSFDGTPTTALPSGGLKNPPLMHNDAWGSQVSSRASHNRDSSLSSLGSASAGPASPYSQNTSNPHIAVTDSPGPGFHGVTPNGLQDGDAFYQMAKSYASQAHDGSNFFPNYPTYHAGPAATAFSSQMGPSPKPKSNDRTLLPPPELSTGAQARSRPVSVASSIASDSPATPSAMEQHHQQFVLADEGARRRNAGFSTLPKLDRTMTDIYSDELYNPNFAISAGTSPTSVGHGINGAAVPISPSNEMFAQRLQAANSQHLSAVQSPAVSVSRGRSPFRNGSPLAPTPAHDFGTAMAAAQNRQHSRFGPAPHQSRAADHDAHRRQAMRHQAGRASGVAAPQTISPKDAVLEFEEVGDNFPLFPQPSANDAQTGLTAEQIDKAVSEVVNSQGGGRDYDPMVIDSTGFDYTSGLQVPQQYPFVAQVPRVAQNANILPGPLRLPITVASRNSNGSSTSSSLEPSRANNGSRSSDGHNSGSSASPGASSPLRGAKAAEDGTYSCTYHGCNIRFDTPALLQKHKREGHRQAHGLGAATVAAANSMQRVDLGTGVPVQLNTQAGPHRCDRINPSTGKPCNTIFSRPYDLTRHEDTIHNARKQKVRCDHCVEEKLFSRADALTRHYRVCHPEVPFPAKFKRRAQRASHHQAGSPY